MQTNVPFSNLAILRSLPIFSDLPEEVLQRLCQSAKVMTCVRGEIIFSEKQECQYLHVVVSGSVKIYKLSDDGREQIIHIMKPGSFFGEEILFAGDCYEANVQALSETTLLNLPRAAMEALVLEHPPFALSLLARFGRRLKRLMMLIGEIALQDVRKRLCRVLLEVAEDEGKSTPQGLEINVHHADLAARVGAARETLSRTLARLEQEGLIVRRGRRIILQDPKRLLREVPHWREDLELFPLDPDRFRQL